VRTVLGEVFDGDGADLGDPQAVEREQARGRVGRPTGVLTGLRSYRVGVYRIIYEPRDDETLRVVATRYRGDAYGTDPR